MKINKTIFLILLILLLGLGIGWLTQAKHTHKEILPITVTAVPVKIQTSPIEWKTIGTVQAENAVTVIPQVTGTIQKIDIKEGQLVKRGDALLSIDPTSFELNLQKAQADFNQNQARLVALQADLKRFKTLLKSGYVAKQQYDQALSNAQAQEAIVAASKNQVDLAKTQLGYAHITSPINGKVGLISPNVGDVVTANQSNLFTINQLDPVLIVFAIPQNKLSTLKEYEKDNKIKISVGSNTLTTPLTGDLVFTDNTVDPNTGTVTLKALVPNPDSILWPGQSLEVSLILATQINAMLVPSKAVQIDQQGNFVYVLENDNAHLQRVQVDREFNELTVIKSGIEANQSVLVDIPPNLVDGAVVKVV
jgi:multidrug efflux system membrane fusion protein